MEDQKPRPGLARNQNVAKGEDLNQKLKFPKISQLGDVVSKQVLRKCITDGGLGEEPPTSGDYGGLGAKPPAAEHFFVIS